MQGIVSNIAIFDTKQTIFEISEIRNRYFWDNNFYKQREKRIYQLELKIAIYAHHMVWILTLLLFISLFFFFFIPRFLYSDDWPYWAKLTIKYSFYIYFLAAYYIGCSHEAFYGHIILHSYFQMNTLIVYLRETFGKYRKMKMSSKIDSFNYQNIVKNVFLLCIKQHQQLTE